MQRSNPTDTAYEILCTPICIISLILTSQSLTVTIRTTSFKIKKILHADYIAFMCSVWLSEETVHFALHAFSRLVFITEVESVYWAVRTESL
jgi:hypothetical protein